MNRGSSKSNAGDVIYDGTGVDALALQSSTRSTQSTPRQLYSEITPNKTRQVGYSFVGVLVCRCVMH